MTPEPRLRVVREDEPSPYPKAALLLRLGARLVDVGVAWALFQSTGPAGVVMALLYILFADGLLGGQSPGKKIFGIKVVYLPLRTGARNRDSVLRNGPLGLILILAMMPDLGLKAFVAGVLVIGTIEAVRVLKDPLGQRLGDLWAQTQVVDGKVPAAKAQAAREEREEARAGGRLMRSRDARPLPREGR